MSRDLNYHIELARNQVSISIGIGIGGIDNYGIVSPVSSDCHVTCDYHVISTAGFVYLGKVSVVMK